MSSGLVILLVVLAGYASNWLNWRFLDSALTRLLYYLGAFVHEGSHAVLCLLTGAKISEFQVFSAQPHVTHGKPKLPLIGSTLISIAPLFGGLLFLFLVNRFVLGGHFSFEAVLDWRSLLREPLELLGQMRIYEWQSWALALLLLNVGAMIGPSTRDIKNIWPALVILFFIPVPALAQIGLFALSLIMAGIIVQAALIACLYVLRLAGKAF
ncbi:MAG: M50 family metallopeptidase [Candidatus Taylorbacteria bacterium]|nr:M50 family metallopeptidase [Candidatus Taylorbacteria bacterium]